jgi:predicted RNase H-like nuclease (RuvC/YqgF family)
LCLQAAFKGTLDDLVEAVTAAGTSLENATRELTNQQVPQGVQHTPANHQQAHVGNNTVASAAAAKQQLHMQLAALRNAVAAAVAASAAQSTQHAALSQEVDQLQTALQEAVARHQELQQQTVSLEDQLAAAGRATEAAQAQLQEVRAIGLVEPKSGGFSFTSGWARGLQICHIGIQCSIEYRRTRHTVLLRWLHKCIVSKRQGSWCIWDEDISA